MRRAEKICTMLRELSKAELVEVEQQMAVLRALEGIGNKRSEDITEQPVADDDYVRALYVEFAQQWKRVLGAKVQPYPVFVKSKLYDKFREAAESVISNHFSPQWMPNCTKNETKHALHIYARLIVEHLQATSGLAMEWTYLPWAMMRLPEIVDRAFPGYVQNGLLSIIIQSQKGDGRNVRRESGTQTRPQR